MTEKIEIYKISIYRIDADIMNFNNTITNNNINFFDFVTGGRFIPHLTF